MQPVTVFPLVFAIAALVGPMVVRAQSKECEAPPGTERFEFDSDNNHLVGFVDLPPSSVPRPIVLVVHGSGTTDVFHAATPYNGRYEILRETFRSAGFATAVWDKAGNGCSTGGYSNGNPIRERSRETLAAVRALKRRGDVDAGKIGIWGISQGGWIGPMVAVQTDDIAFLILVSAPARDAVSQLEYQALTDLRTRGVPAAEIRAAAKHLRRGFAIMRAGGGVDEYAAAVEPLKKYPTFRELNIVGEGTADDLRRWQNDVDFQYRPDTALRELRQPVLAVFGDQDVLIDWRESRRIFADAFRAGGNRDFTIEVFENADHNLTIGPDPQPIAAYRRALSRWLAGRRVLAPMQ